MISELVRSLERWTSPVDPGAYLGAWNPLWAGRQAAVIERVTPLTTTAASIEIHPGRGWAGHRAGQFVTVGVDVDGVRHHRCYSLTSPPNRPDGHIEIAVQAVPGGTVSTHLVERARPGDVIRLTPADGDFTLPNPLPRPLLLIAGGSGITPLMGMLRTLATTAPTALDVVLLHHTPDPSRTMFADELVDMAADTPWLAVDIQHTRRDGARLDAVTIEARCPDWRHREAFVCGPESLLEVVTHVWDGQGLLDQLHLERFTPTRRTEGVSDGSTARVTFDTSGRDAVSNDDTTLLELAESAGLAPAYGCRMGVCHTCTTPLLAGCARDLRNGRLSEAGTHVQLCVSAPAGDLTLDL